MKNIMLCVVRRTLACTKSANRRLVLIATTGWRVQCVERGVMDMEINKSYSIFSNLTCGYEKAVK